MSNWFSVDKEGLSKILEKKGKGFVILELIQNSWDQNVHRVEVSLVLEPRKPYATLKVADDDPDGFSDLSHAFTLFAESNKKSNPEQRGRFNLGEKLVLSLCEEATISSTKGTVIFNKSGRKVNYKQKQAVGSMFTGLLRMTREEYNEAVRLVKTVIPPRNIETIFNGEKIDHRLAAAKFEATLPTDISDGSGFLRRSMRATTIEIYLCREGEIASIYEMGIPVVATGDKYHVNIMQKVPLNMDRDNVTPAFLQTVRTFAFNNMFNTITEEDASTDWVRDATSDDRCSQDAKSYAMDLRFGKKRVIYDPSDVEANAKAFSEGYTVIKGPQLNKTEWQNVKMHSLALPAGQVTPAKPQFSGSSPGVPENKWTTKMKSIADYAKRLALELMGVKITVDYLDCEAGNIRATYEKNTISSLVFYLKNFDPENIDDISLDALLIHEFGHEYSSDHLSSSYHDALCKLGAKLKVLAVNDRIAGRNRVAICHSCNSPIFAGENKPEWVTSDGDEGWGR